MYLDSDIKIVGDRPSEDVKRNKQKADNSDRTRDKNAIKKAKLWGEAVAKSYIKAAREKSDTEENGNEDMVIHRRMLLSFTATVGFEQYASDDTISGIAEKSFLDNLKQADSELYATSTDTGAFSFYYLAYRRGGEVERRMGQTFAMLCSHDGDPIYQELGEALYCWFLSQVKKSAEEIGI